MRLWIAYADIGRAFVETDRDYPYNNRPSIPDPGKLRLADKLDRAGGQRRGIRQRTILPWASAAPLRRNASSLILAALANKYLAYLSSIILAISDS